MEDKFRTTAITFDDVLLEPRFSAVVPSEVNVTHTAHQEHPAESPADQLSHGHGD